MNKRQHPHTGQFAKGKKSTPAKEQAWNRRPWGELMAEWGTIPEWEPLPEWDPMEGNVWTDPPNT